jgi:RimJ/RimL family protein N-acetyltransferase
MPVALETRRLRLRRLEASDEADLIALDLDPEVMRYVGSPAGVKTPAETAERARERIRAGRSGEQELLGFWVIEGREDRAFLGLGALLFMPTRESGFADVPDVADVEVAYRLARSAWGRGFATEAAGALVAHALRTVGLPRVVAVTYPENQASQRVLDKLGFEPRGFLDYKGVRATYHVLTQAVWAAAPGLH